MVYNNENIFLIFSFSFYRRAAMAQSSFRFANNNLITGAALVCSARYRSILCPGYFFL